MSIGSWKIDDTPTFVVNTHDPSDGSASDADSVPTYRIYEDETTTPILTGSMALLDSANTEGFYSEQITLSAGNGFEKGKSYNIYITATVGGIAGTTSRSLQIEAEVDVNTLSDTTTLDARIDNRLAAIGLDHLLSAAVAGGDVVDDSIIAQLVSKEATADWDDFVNTTDSLQAIKDALLTAANINTEVSDVIKTDTISEMSQQVPPAAPTLEEAIMYLYMSLRNQMDITSTLKEFHNDAGTVIWKKTLSDDGTTYSEAEGASGP